MAFSTDKGHKQTKRFEGISLVYLVFFVLAVMAPSLVRRDYFGISQTVLEETFIFVMGLASLLTVVVYERMMEKRLLERDTATQNVERVTKELVESYKYIGSINRQLEVLKKLANETSISLVKSDAYWKDLLQSLASNAASCVNAPRVLVRFVELEKLRTDREVFFSRGAKDALKLSNKELRKLHDQHSISAFFRTEDGCELLVVASDQKDSPIHAFLIVEADASRITDVDISLMKVFANQAELVYASLIRTRESAETPIQILERMTAEPLREVT